MNAKLELLDRLYQVQEALLENIAELKEIARADPANYQWARSYIISHLECTVTDQHEWLDSSQNISDWISKLEEECSEFDGTTDEAGNEICFCCGLPVDECDCADGDEDNDS